MGRNYLLKVISLFVIGTLVTGSRLLSLRGSNLTSSSFSTIQGYESLAYAQHFANGTLSFPAKVGSGGEGVVSTSRFAYELCVGIISYVLGGSMETTVLLLKLLGPIFFGIAAVGLILLTKEITDNFGVAVFAGLLFSLFPGTILEQTTALSGTRLGFELALIVWFFYSLMKSYTLIEENYIIISDRDIETLRQENSSVYLLLLPLLGVLGSFTSVSVGVTMLTVLFLSILGITLLWEPSREAYEEVVLGSVSVSSLISIAVGLSVVLTGGLSNIGSYSILLLLVLFALVLSVIGLLSNLYGPDRRLAVVEGILGVGYLGGISILFFGQETIIGYFTSSLPFVESYLYQTTPLWSQSTPIEDLYVAEFGLLAYIGYLGFAAFLYMWTTENSKWVSLNKISSISIGLTLLLFHIGSSQFLPFFSVFVSVFTAYMVYIVVSEFNVDTISLTKEDLISSKLLVIMFILLLVAPTLLVPVSDAGGNIVTQSEKTTLSPDSSNSIIQFVSENTEQGETVLTWDQSQAVILESQTQAYTTGNTPESATQTANILTSSTESATQVTEYIVLSGSQVTATGDYGSMAEISSNERQDHFQLVYEQRSGEFGFSTYKQPYYDSLATRLYLYHGQAFPGGNVSQTYSEQGDNYFTRPAEDIAKQNHIQKFENSEELQTYLDEETEGNITKKSGGIGVHPPERVSALENHRYVYSDTSSVLQTPRYSEHISQYQDFSEDLGPRDFVIDPAATKVFQQVPGTEITIENMPPESTAQIFITLENEQTGTPMRYITTAQSNENGVGEVTVPYATQNNPESYSVKPAKHDEYEIIVRTQTLTTSEGSDEVIPETQVRHASIPVTNEDVVTGTQSTVTLEEISQEEYQQIIQRQQPEQLQNQSETEDNNDS